jgi:hypothetical protein
MTENEREELAEKLARAAIGCPNDGRGYIPRGVDAYACTQAAAVLRAQPEPPQDAPSEASKHMAEILGVEWKADRKWNARKAELERAIIQERKDHGERYAEAMIECNRLDARNAELEQQLAAAEPHIRAKGKL